MNQPRDWWHRDHPTFTALTGFFVGLLYVALVPGLWLAALDWAFDDETTAELFPLVLVGLALPTALALLPRTRRFGKYMLFGVAITLAVVVGVGTTVFWLMMRFQG
ncbi:hypothetical protein [Nocardioides limicola]|uniref:hypothetical protein n=1 Tax=Nocardioides limicola TaxID=2803368 RepID=UPI0027DC22B4|nr:hypothetical protein [Nocardioides sp. DJM-14]